MNRKASFNGVADAIKGLSDEEQVAIVESRGALKAFAAKLVVEKRSKIYIVHLDDQDVSEKFQPLVPKYRQLAMELGYSGPIAWQVRAGFTLKTHASQAGPCYKKFQYLQDWNLKNDEPTKDSLVFWIPRLLMGSKGKSVNGQMKLLAETRSRLELPEHHLKSFGSAGDLSGLIFAPFKRTGERVPLNGDWTRTDTFHADGDRLGLGDFDRAGLHCHGWHWDEDGNDSLGCFPLGVEESGGGSLRNLILATRS